MVGSRELGLLFNGDERLAESWEVVSGGNKHKDYLLSVRNLMGNRDRLPGVVMIDLPVRAGRTQDIDDILMATQPLCLCGWRRLLVGRRERRDVLCGQEITLKSGSGPVYLGPHAGDLSATFLSFRIEGKRLLGREFPFVQQGWPGYRDALTEVPFTLDMLAKRVGDHAIEITMCVDPDASTNQLVCKITQADPAAGTVTIVVDAAASVISPKLRQHSCLI